MYALNNREPDSLTKKSCRLTEFILFILSYSRHFYHMVSWELLFLGGEWWWWCDLFPRLVAEQNVPLWVCYIARIVENEMEVSVSLSLFGAYRTASIFSLPALECVAALSLQLKPGILLRRPQRFKTGLSGPLCLYKYHWNSIQGFSLCLNVYLCTFKVTASYLDILTCASSEDH